MVDINDKLEEATAKALEAAKRLEAANKRREELLLKEEETEINKVLGGKADASPTPIKKEETPAEYAKRVLSGNV